MLDLIQELKTVMEDKKIQPTTAAVFLRCSARQIDRWLKGQSTPTLMYRDAIKKGIKRMERL